jgi:hypothetical protein
VLITVSFFYLFVCVDSHGKGCLAKTKYFLFTQFPDGLRWIGRKTFG